MKQAIICPFYFFTANATHFTHNIITSPTNCNKTRQPIPSHSYHPAAAFGSTPPRSLTQSVAEDVFDQMHVCLARDDVVVLLAGLLDRLQGPPLLLDGAARALDDLGQNPTARDHSRCDVETHTLQRAGDHC